MRLPGRVVWITGGSSGIGAALAHEVARRGGRVAITAGRADRLQRVAGTAPGEVRAFPADVRDRAGIAAAARRVAAEMGPVDVAVLGAGTWEQIDALRWDSEPIRQQIETNLVGLLNSLDPLVPVMVARSSGVIMGIASVAGYRGFTRSEGYSATKAASINLLEALRIDLAGAGVRVQVVNPGFVRTELTDRNDFPMPFMMEADAAARRIADAIEKEKAETVFPRPYLAAMKLARLLPVRPYTAVSAMLARRGR